MPPATHSRNSALIDHTCTTCGAPLTSESATASNCLACRAKLAADDSERLDLRAIARWQRRFGSCVLVGLIIMLLVLLPDGPGSLIGEPVWMLWPATRVLVVLSGLQLFRLLQFRVNVGVPVAVMALVMLPIIPAGDLAVWALLTAAARRALCAAGIDAGWWGVADEDVCRQLGICRCGYNLTGNASGRCPECGTDVPPPPADDASDDPLAADIERFS